jgi:excisionase family DNA binding protein
MESKPAKRANHALFTASDLARFCQVDLKTIHNWAEKGEIPHFRTPGRHLRFRRLDVVEFLRKYGYAIPDALRGARPNIVVVEQDATTLAAIKRALAKRFEVTAFHEPVDALVSLATSQTDALVLDVDIPGFDGVRFLARLRANAATSHVRVFVYTAHLEFEPQVLEAGAASFVAKGSPATLRAVLEAVLEERLAMDA